MAHSGAMLGCIAIVEAFLAISLTILGCLGLCLPSTCPGGVLIYSPQPQERRGNRLQQNLADSVSALTLCLSCLRAFHQETQSSNANHYNCAPAPARIQGRRGHRHTISACSCPRKIACVAQTCNLPARAVQPAKLQKLTTQQ